jgi:hypothetical protein
MNRKAILLSLSALIGLQLAALAIETQLNGLKLFRKNTDVLRMFGNPDRITVGSMGEVIIIADALQAENVAAPSGQAAPPSAPEGEGGDGQKVVVKQNISYIYRRPDNTTMSVTIDQSGRIAEIVVYALSVEAFKKSKAVTSKGIRFGMTYKDVLKKYGDPDNHQPLSNGGMVLDYTEKNNIKFQLDSRMRVIAIDIATNEAFVKKSR